MPKSIRPGDSTERHRSPVKPDGRSVARERNRLAVVDALLDLYAEGNLRPDAQEVADRSGVSRRSVFRYFDGFDDLGHAANVRASERYRHLLDLPTPARGSLAQRVRQIARQRTALFEAARAAAIVMRLRAPFHAGIANELSRNRKVLARQVEQQFARELLQLSAAKRAKVLAAADLLCAFEAYEHLVSAGHSASEIEAILGEALTQLFA